MRLIDAITARCDQRREVIGDQAAEVLVPLLDAHGRAPLSAIAISITAT